MATKNRKNSKKTTQQPKPVVPKVVSTKPKSLAMQEAQGLIAKSHYINGKSRNKKIILESKRGTKTTDTCTSCNTYTTVWRYSKSNRGVVNLCGNCKKEAFNNSFGKKDALDYANTGGRFEGNRSKH